MALLSFVELDTPSLVAQGGQRRPENFNGIRDISSLRNKRKVLNSRFPLSQRAGPDGRSIIVSPGLRAHCPKLISRRAQFPPDALVGFRVLCLLIPDPLQQVSPDFG